MTLSIQNKMARGAGWMVLMELVDRALGLVSIFILVRLLTPADFGIVAMAISFVAMAKLLIAFGFDIAIIQNADATDEHYHSAWTCNVILGAAVTVVLLAAAWPAAQFYREPDVFLVLCALAFGPFFASLENIGLVRFRKELEFKKDFMFRAVRRLITFFVALPLAFLIRNYWALVAGILVTNLGGAALSYVAHEFRPRFCLTKVRELFNFSKWLLVNNVLGFFKEHSADFVIGRVRGAGSLGLYGMSYEISAIPTSNLSAPINRAVLPGFAKLDPGESLRHAYGNAMGLLMLIALPAAAGIYAVAPFLVPVTMGAKWLDSTALIEVLAFNGAAMLFHSSIGAVLVARGNPRDNVRANTIYVLLLLASLVALVPRYGALGAAYAATLTAVTMTPVFLFLIKRRIGVGMMVFARAVFRPVLASILMALTIRWALPHYEESMAMAQAASFLIAGVALGAVTYTSLVCVFWMISGRPVSAESIVLERVRNLFSAALSLRGRPR